MAAKKTDPRGPVVIVTQWPHEDGPTVHFPYSLDGITPASRMISALRAAASKAARIASVPGCTVTTGVFVQERGKWVPA